MSALIIFFQKENLVILGDIYKPPSQSWFLDQVTTWFAARDFNDEIYILGDLNLPPGEKCIFTKQDKTNSVKNFHHK